MHAAASHEFWMRAALTLAAKAATQNEVPIGAIVVLDQQIIGQGWNRPITTCDPTAHAEIIALRQAAQYLNNYRLAQASLYVTLEPCLMCAGALIQARVSHVIFGTHDGRASAIGVASSRMLLENMALNHHVNYLGGVLAAESATLLKQFFAKRRCVPE